jgi:hypothetical protein
VKSTSRHEENNDDDKACNYQLMMSFDRCGYGCHGHSPPLQSRASIVLTDLGTGVRLLYAEYFPAHSPLMKF